MNENYNPMERRSRGVKDRSSKGCQKNFKSLQMNNSMNSGSCNGMGNNRVTAIKQGKPSGAAAGIESSMEILALTKELTELKLSVNHLEKERDFYFAKLRDIEILCEAHDLDNLPMAMGIKRILYAADENDSALAEAQEIVSRSIHVEENGFSDNYD